MLNIVCVIGCDQYSNAYIDCFQTMSRIIAYNAFLICAIALESASAILINTVLIFILFIFKYKVVNEIIFNDFLCLLTNVRELLCLKMCLYVILYDGFKFICTCIVYSTHMNRYLREINQNTWMKFIVYDT